MLTCCVLWEWQSTCKLKKKKKKHVRGWLHLWLDLTLGILQHPDGTVLKQLQPPPRGPREMQFYCKVSSV